jgi:hypothetical protein
MIPLATEGAAPSLPALEVGGVVLVVSLLVTVLWLLYLYR